LLRLRLDRSCRQARLATLNPDAAKLRHLGSLTREYTLYEIAIMTRAGPARSLGLKNKGHLGTGADADVVLYREHADRERMFSDPEYVFKGGTLVATKGRICAEPIGTTHVTRAEFDARIETDLDKYFDRYMTMKKNRVMLADSEIEDEGRGKIAIHRARRRT
jgi:formylmethanofuran dehydrogenase subunit A